MKGEKLMEATTAAEASPAPVTTVRRNPPRRARPPPTPLTSTKTKPSLSRLLDEAAAASTTITPSISEEPDRLKVFLRIRPLPIPERDLLPKPTRPKPKEPKKKPKPPGLCLVATGATSVALTVPHSKLTDAKRTRTEVFDGFSAVFSPDSSQDDVFTRVMNPLVDDFMGSKSALLVAMGPTGSGKTHTVFGSARNPGILPLTLRRIFAAREEGKDVSQSTRSFCLSMFEILSDGKNERLLDLLSDAHAPDLVLQQSTIKGLKEVFIANFVDAESLVSRGMVKRSTAATSANSKSSRSQCIITIRAVDKRAGVEGESSQSSAVLTIADLAGAERERRTGNQGTKLLESNFINNTSMVLGLCLRSLLEHQKNKKKPLEKHFKNSVLTRYLRDYLEGRKKMTLILNVKPGDDDYSDTSYLLRQASPYMKIKYTNIEDTFDLGSQKRSNGSLICQENKKKRKVLRDEISAVAAKDNIDKDDDIRVSGKDESQDKFLNSELQRVSRNEEIMTNFARALWNVLKQHKQKLVESENAVESMRNLLRGKDIQIMELEKELKALNSSSCKKSQIVGDPSVEQNIAVSSGEAAQSLVSLSNHTDLGSSESEIDNFHLVAEEVSEESTCHGPESSSVYCDMKGKSEVCDASVNLIDEGLSSRDFKPGESCSSDASGSECDVKKEINQKNAEAAVQVLDKESNRSESCSEQTSLPGGGLTHASSHLDHAFDRSISENHILPCLQSERDNLSPQFTVSSKRSPMEQIEDAMKESSSITVEGIQHYADTGEVKHPNSSISSQQLNSDVEDASFSQYSLQLQGALHQNRQELDPQSERCETMVGKTIVEYDTCKQNPQAHDSLSERCEPTVEKKQAEYGVQSPNLVNHHEGIFPCVLNQEAPSIPPIMDYQTEGLTDETEDLSATKTCSSTKKTTRRRLMPASAMNTVLVKEFTGLDIDGDTTKREERVKAGGKAVGRSDKLFRYICKVSTNSS